MERDIINELIIFSMENPDFGIIKSINVDGANGRYYIVRDGQVISFCNGEYIFLNPMNNGKGYKYIRIGNKNYYIHKLVADSFLIYDKSEKRQIHHIDLNPSNNNVSNLLPVSDKQHRFIHKILRRFHADLQS